MHPSTTHIRALAAGLAAVTALSLGAANALAQAPQTGSAASTAANGVHYFSTDASTTIRVTLAGNTFTIDDAVAITPGTGCSPVTGDTTQVRCVVQKDQFGKLRPFFVDAGRGDDTVENATTVGNTPGAGMIGEGNGGNDVLVGGNEVIDDLRGLSGRDTLRGGDEFAGGGGDVLNGGAGDDTLQGGKGRDKLFGGSQRDNLDGGDNPDTLDGGGDGDVIDGGLLSSDGFFSQDTVAYDRVSPVTVDLSRTDASQGAAGEGDTILRVENVMGGRGNDGLLGNAENNTLIGGPGNDNLFGEQGRDTLRGEDGNDVLFPSPTIGFAGVVADGVSDIMECGEGVDTALRVVVPDGDLVNRCETVFDQ